MWHMQAVRTKSCVSSFRKRLHEKHRLCFISCSGVAGSISNNQILLKVGSKLPFLEQYSVARRTWCFGVRTKTLFQLTHCAYFFIWLVWGWKNFPLLVWLNVMKTNRYWTSQGNIYQYRSSRDSSIQFVPLQLYYASITFTRLHFSTASPSSSLIVSTLLQSLAYSLGMTKAMMDTPTTWIMVASSIPSHTEGKPCRQGMDPVSESINKLESKPDWT